MNVAVIGTGYVGLTTGVALAYIGHKVACIDVDEAKVEGLRKGILPIYEPGLEELLAMSQDNIFFTTDYEAGIPDADVVFIAVGTPPMSDGNPDLSYLKDAAHRIGNNLGLGFTVVINKSTVPIGSGNWVESLISDAFESRNGKKPLGSFCVASNPEFLREGTGVFDTLYPDRIVLGSDNLQAIDLLTRLYRPIINQNFTPPVFCQRPDGLQAVPVVTTDLASAELIKYSANAFLALKISFINEIADLAERVGADTVQIAKGIGLDSRIGTKFLNAGIGWGGSCFGKDTAALVATAKDYRLVMPIIEASRTVNYRIRTKVVDKLLGELKILKGKTVGLLGLAFKPNTDDLRDAPALEIAQRLVERGAKVLAHDPIAMERAKRETSHIPITFVENPEELFNETDAVVLVTEWQQYKELPYQKLVTRMRKPVIFDGRNVLNKEQLEESGYRCLGVGR